MIRCRWQAACRCINSARCEAFVACLDKDLLLVCLLLELSGILTCWLDILALANNSAQFFCAELPGPLQGKKYMEVRRCAAAVLSMPAALLIRYRMRSAGKAHDASGMAWCTFLQNMFVWRVAIFCWQHAACLPHTSVQGICQCCGVRIPEP